MLHQRRSNSRHSHFYSLWWKKKPTQMSKSTEEMSIYWRMNIREGVYGTDAEIWFWARKAAARARSATQTKFCKRKRTVWRTPAHEAGLWRYRPQALNLKSCSRHQRDAGTYCTRRTGLDFLNGRTFDGRSVTRLSFNTNALKFTIREWNELYDA